jgi:cardiolipin synthase A/B
MSTWGALYVASEWIVRLVMLFYVPQRRDPAAARAWLLLIFFLPWVGVILYAIVGRAYLPRARLEMQHTVSRLIRELQPRILGNALATPDLPQEYEPAAKLTEALSDFAVCRGNRFELITDYQGAVDRLVEDIDQAQRNVHLMYYIFRGDATGQRVAAALGRAAARGVSCRLLGDGYGSWFALRRLGPALRSQGIEVALLMPPRLWGPRAIRLDLRNHRKIAVVDGRVGYVGSQNIVDPDANQGLTNEELVARVTGPVVRQLQAVFLADRYYETRQLPSEANEELLPPGQDSGTSLAQVLPSGPGYHRENTQQIMIALLHAARSRAVLTTPYFMPDASFLLSMRMAAERGVEVDLIVSDRSNKPIVQLAQESNYDGLLDAGVRIHRYYGNFLHAKHATIDTEIALIGSSNLDNRSFALNNEVSVLVYDRAVVAELAAIQARYLAASRRVDASQWARRSIVRKALQNIARLTDTLI